MMAVSLAAMAVVIFSAWFIMRQDGRYKMPVTGYLYQYGGEYKIPAGETLLFSDEGGLAHVGRADSSQVLDGTPVYLEPGDRFLLAVDAVYRDPRKNVYGRLTPGTVVQQVKGPSLAENKTGEASLDRGVIFDGSNVYIFLEKVLVEFNGRKVEFPAFSYVRAVPGGMISIFNFETKEFVQEELVGEARADCVDYFLSLTGDTLIYPDGRREILANQPVKLPSLIE